MNEIYLEMVEFWWDTLIWDTSMLILKDKEKGVESIIGKMVVP